MHGINLTYIFDYVLVFGSDSFDHLFDLFDQNMKYQFDLKSMVPAKLPDTIKSQVVQQWLTGRSRNEIAAENGLSSGAVTNIVIEWRRGLGLAAAEELRELAVTLKKVGINAAQCATGFRIATTIFKTGINEDSFESFILDVYNQCKDIGISPQSISSYLQDLIGFSRDVLPITKIPGYIREKKDEKTRLEEEIEKLNVQISTLTQEKRNCESLRDQALLEKEMTISELRWYSNLKSELKKYSIQVDDVLEFVRLVNNLRQYSNFDVEKVINEFWDLELLRTNHDKLQQDTYSLKNDINSLEQERSTLEADIKIHNQTISTYNSLKTMGFGLKELDFLYDTINEIATENNIPVAKAVKKFLLDVEEQYDKKLGFEDKLQKMRDEFNNLRKEQSKLRIEILSNPLIGPKLLKLIQSGVSEQDIINVAAVIEKYSALAGNNIDNQSLVSDIEKYAGLHSAVEHLTKQVDMLRKDAVFLENQKQNLDQDNQRILSSSIRLRHIVDFLEGNVFSLRSEIMNLILICIFIMHLLKSQVHTMQRAQLHQADEFAALSRSSNGEDVPIKDIKEAVVRSIQVLLNRIGPNNDTTLACDLLIAYNALKE
jgi:hypothetical protein